MVLLVVAAWSSVDLLFRDDRTLFGNSSTPQSTTISGPLPEQKGTQWIAIKYTETELILNGMGVYI